MDPLEVWSAAQQAARAGDWVGVCRWLSDKDVERLLPNAVILAASRAPAEAHAVAARYGLELPSLSEAGSFRQRLAQALDQVAEPNALLGDLEALTRRAGGGSLSSQHFAATLEQVTVDGRTARAVRRFDQGHTDEVTFVRQKDGWRVCLVTRRGRR